MKKLPFLTTVFFLLFAAPPAWSGADVAGVSCFNGIIDSTWGDECDYGYQQNGQIGYLCTAWCQDVRLSRYHFIPEATTICEGFRPSPYCPNDKCRDAVNECIEKVTDLAWGIVKEKCDPVTKPNGIAPGTLYTCGDKNKTDGINNYTFTQISQIWEEITSKIAPDITKGGRFDTIIVGVLGGGTSDPIRTAINGQKTNVRTNCLPPPSPVCGNGRIETGEQCDDGNTVSGDGCSSTCQTDTPQPVCGNGTVEGTEQCDQGAANSDTAPNACRTNCRNASCGDGVKDSAETCDEGPLNGSPNHCNAACTGTTTPVCGNGAVEAGETCDDGNILSGDGCLNCQAETPPVTPPPECTTNAQCTGGKVCVGGTCQPCTFDGQCATGLVCEGGACTSPIPPGTCTNDSDCLAPRRCVSGKCVNPTGCTADKDCASGLICENGQCVTPPVTGCTSNADCGEGRICQDGTCVSAPPPDITAPPPPSQTQPEAQPVAMGGGGCGCRMGEADMEPKNLAVLAILFALGLLPLIGSRLRRT